MKTRVATSAEILTSEQLHIKLNMSVQYRHFVREISNPRAKKGVNHRQYSRSLLRDIDGEPYVMYHGKLEKIRGQHITLESGRTFTACYVIDSPYL